MPEYEASWNYGLHAIASDSEQPLAVKQHGGW